MRKESLSRKGLIKLSTESGINYNQYFKLFNFFYRNPYRSKIASAIIGGISDIYIRPGGKVLYLGAASGTTCSHVADIVGEVIIL